MGKDITTSYIVVSLGSNDGDNYFHETSSIFDPTVLKTYNRKKEKREMNMKLDEIKPSLLKTLNFLVDNVKGAELLYIKILPRPWWHIRVRKMARWIDYYVLVYLHKRFKVREIWARELFETHYHFKEQVMFGMLTTDQVHLNTNGHKGLVSVIMRPLLHKWKAAVNK